MPRARVRVVAGDDGHLRAGRGRGYRRAQGVDRRSRVTAGEAHGLDVDGEPVDPPEGPVFVKYNSDSGDAFLSGYGGEYRGVLFTPELGDGAFRQYGYLPLDLPAGGKR